MKQGTAVHKKLEEEIHITVPVQTVKKEDSWGLRIWNICQGLKTLRETGKTRELEIWGTIGGELVNGIIDELNYECPDPKHEEKLRAAEPISDLPEYQTSIREYLLQKPEKEELTSDQLKKNNETWIYLTDIKTRATPTLPTGSSLRPVIAQLHLYHHMLENLAQNNFSLDLLTDRYGLDSHEVFSDSFLAQLGSLEVNSSAESADDASSNTRRSQDPMDILLQHNTLHSLWQHMISQFQQTFLLEKVRPGTDFSASPASEQSTSDLPPPDSQPTRLAPLLSAVYLSSPPRRRSDTEPPPSRILGRKSFDFDPAFLHSYLTETLSWWRGERDAQGVTLQEAWKCRSCDFKADCSWIQDRDKQALDEALQRKKMREIADVEPAVISPTCSHV